MKKLCTGIVLLFVMTTNKPHTCPYVHCPFTGLITYAHTDECELYSDCYYLDLIHFSHPFWDYDQTEDYLFSENQ